MAKYFKLFVRHFNDIKEMVIFSFCLYSIIIWDPSFLKREELKDKGGYAQLCVQLHKMSLWYAVKY